MLDWTYSSDPGSVLPYIGSAARGSHRAKTGVSPFPRSAAESRSKLLSNCSNLLFTHLSHTYDCASLLCIFYQSRNTALLPELHPAAC